MHMEYRISDIRYIGSFHLYRAGCRIEKSSDTGINPNDKNEIIETMSTHPL